MPGCIHILPAVVGASSPVLTSPALRNVSQLLTHASASSLDVVAVR